jgi:hypothetical protein
MSPHRIPPGNSFISPDDPNLPRTVEDLRKEFPSLPESVYRTFQQGVNYQLSSDNRNAQLTYRKLERIPRKGGETFDLCRVSKTIQHNVNLINRKGKK